MWPISCEYLSLPALRVCEGGGVHISSSFWSTNENSNVCWRDKSVSLLLTSPFIRVNNPIYRWMRLGKDNWHWGGAISLLWGCDLGTCLHFRYLGIRSIKHFLMLKFFALFSWVLSSFWTGFWALHGVKDRRTPLGIRISTIFLFFWLGSRLVRIWMFSLSVSVARLPSPSICWKCQMCYWKCVQVLSVHQTQVLVP